VPTDDEGERAARPHAPRHQGFGHAPDIGATTRLECKVCWTVYDPAEGDPHWQIPPGTPFTALPPHWTCPNCSATLDQFLVVCDDD
jgi:rubredoxin